MRRMLWLIFALQLIGLSSQGKINHFPVRKLYLTNGFDGAIFSTARLSKTMTIDPVGGGSPTNVTSNSLSGLRFSLILNAGTLLNYNINRHFGVFTGLDIKNIGFIEYITQDSNHYTIKRRTYNIGIPVGIKLGNTAMDRGGILFLGGGLDMPFNYKEKSFILRSHKTMFNEWFSNRVPLLMPYVSIGVVGNSGVSLKFQYYPGNFLNQNYTDGNGNRPYSGYNVHLILFSIGYIFRTYVPGEKVHRTDQPHILISKN